MPTPSPHPTAKPTPTPSADPDISTRNEEISYTLCTLGDYEFSIPDYYGEAVESSESKAVYQLDMGNNNIRVLEIDSGSIETPPTALSFNLGCNWQFTQWHNENSKKYSNYSQGENSIFSHDNLLYGATFGVVGYSDGAVILIMSIISSPDSNNVIAMIWSVITSDQENIVSDITSEYLYILNSIILTSSKSTPSSISPSPIPSPKPTPAPTPSPSPAPAGIRPEVKELLDNYEAVMDEYIAFMEKYLDADSENMLGMLSDYYRILNEYSEMLEKINALDTDELNSEELAYYLEVTSRVTQKLLKASS